MGRRTKNKYFNKKKSRTVSNKPRHNFRKSHSSDDLFDASQKLTDNSSSFNRILKPKNKKIDNTAPLYLSQFEEQTFDSHGNPSANNDIYQSDDKNKLDGLGRKISYQEGWSSFSPYGEMSYGIIPDNQLMHNNMIPDFKLKSGYGSNDLHNNHVLNYKNELFTGNFKDTWKNKKEVAPFFKPETNWSHLSGMPVPEERDRYHVSQKKQNEKPFESIQVTPGVGLDYHEKATHGYHSMFRPLEKTVDQLRVKPKITYEGRIIDGQRGTKRPLQAPVITYRPSSFKTNTEDDLLPTYREVDGPKVRENILLKETARTHQNVEYTGGAHSKDESVGKNVPEELRPKQKYSTKQNFTLPKPLQKFSKSDTLFNANLNSYHLPATIKDQTINNSHLGQIQNTTGQSTYTFPTEQYNPTLKEITSSTPHTQFQITPNTMRGTVHSLDLANPTIKEMTCENKLNPFSSLMDNKQAVYYSDAPQTTTKEQTILPISPFNANHQINTYATLMDSAKETMKETVNQIPRPSMILPVNQHQRTPNPTDTPQTTMKEMTHQPQSSFMTPINQQGVVYSMEPNQTTMKEIVNQTPHPTHSQPINQQQRMPNPTDTPQTTLKETTINVPYSNIITSVNQQQGCVNSMDTAKTTLKETVNQIPRITFSQPINQQQRTPNLNNPLSTTIKETTNSISRPTMFSSMSHQKGLVHQNDPLKTTIKETTNSIPYHTTVVPINQQGIVPLQDTMRTTTKEQTNSIDRPTSIQPINKQRAPNFTDTTRTTMKEMSMQKPRNHSITPVNQQQRAPDPSDILKTTQKETTSQIPRHTFSMPINQQQRAPNPTDTFKTTMKESTIQIPYQTSLITPINKKQTSQPMDSFRTTNKEITSQIPHQTMATAVNRYGQVGCQDTFKTTVKEITSQIPYHTHSVAVNQQQRVPNPTDTLKTTIKELSNQTPHQTYITPTNKKGMVSPTDAPNTTIKETTVQIPYQTHTTAVNQQQRTPYPTDALKTTLKEETIQIPYQTYITPGDQKQGMTSTFNRTPPSITNKETVIDNQYLGQAQGDMSGKGYGYLANKKQAPNTNKQFQCQEVYLGQAQGESKPKSYESMYQSRLNEKKEALQIYRSPTTSNVAHGPDPSHVNIKLRDDNHTTPSLFVGQTFNNKLDRFKPITTNKISNQLSDDYFIDPKLLEQLNSNPYHISFPN